MLHLLACRCWPSSVPAAPALGVRLCLVHPMPWSKVSLCQRPRLRRCCPCVGTWPGTHNHGMESEVPHALCPLWISCAADMRGRGVGMSPMPGTRKGPTLSRAKTMPREVEEGRQHQQDVQRLHFETCMVSG